MIGLRNAFKSLTRGRRKTERGDTIVEVLLAVAVLGSVLGSAYVIVNKNTKNAQVSQERLQAVKIAESQLERLKIKATADPTVLSRTNFCFDPNNNILFSSDAGCKMDASGMATTVDPAYNVLIRNDRAVSYGGANGTRFKITVSWDGINGINSKIDYYYEVYP